jgi:alpha-tubulin suppressor-like RCC1 family protein
MKLETIDNVKQVAAGSSHTCAIINDGDVMCWGANDDGQLGLGWENPYMFCCSDRNLVIGFGGTNPGP